jgi:hypothetical protein
VFKSVESRYILRACVAGLVAAAVSLQSQLPLDWADLGPGLIAFVVGAGAYAGVGAAVPQVEPNIGVKGEPL